MGLIDDLREIGKFNKYKNREKSFERELYKRSIRDTQFVRQFNNYMEALVRDLNKKFNEEGYTEIHYKPKQARDSQFFEAFRDDERMTEIYNIEPLNDGSYRFTLTTIEGLEDVQDYLDGLDGVERGRNYGYGYESDYDYYGEEHGNVNKGNLEYVHNDDY